LNVSGSQWLRPTAREELALPMISQNSEMIFVNSHRPEIVSAFVVT
jgi:hypothetical protein